MTKVITYHSENARPSEAWIGYVVLDDGSYWRVRFVGASEDDIIAHARKVFSEEKSKQSKLEGATNIKEADSVPSVRGQGITPEASKVAGKVWMLNRTTGHRTRIDAKDYDAFVAKGYIKGGPRSK